MFSAIRLNGRGRPLTTFQTVVNLIGHTRTKKSLTIQADLDLGSYPTGQKPTEESLENLQIERPDGQHVRWNYTIKPHRKPLEEELVC